MEKKILSAAETSAFCNQLALILGSGISALEGLTILQEDSVGEEKVLVGQILDVFSQTADLKTSLEQTGRFPAYMIRMVGLGEETGTLDNVMAALAKHYDREDAISRAVKGSVTYPLTMASMMVVVILVLLVKVMPIFNQVFVQLGSEMTGLSRSLYLMGTALSGNGSWLLALLLILILAVFFGIRTAAGRNWAVGILRNIPLTRSLFEHTATARFSGAMALALSSGLDPERALELAGQINEDPALEKKLLSCRQRVSQGEDLSKALHETQIFDGVNARLILIAQKTGSMDRVMDQIADRSQNAIEDQLGNLLAVIEPTLVVSLSVIVGVILLSVMLPLMGIMSSL